MESGFKSAVRLVCILFVCTAQVVAAGR